MITKQFVLAGRAVFTLEVPATFQVQHKTSTHYTFRVSSKDNDYGPGKVYFAWLLTGPDNTSDYTYLGKLLDGVGNVKLTDKSKYGDDSMPVKLLRRTLARIWHDEQQVIVAAGFALHHEGRCARCGRVLTVPESIKNGFGPECITKI